MYKKFYPFKNNKDDADLPLHDGWVMQGLVCGYIVIHEQEEKVKAIHVA